jgi:hypothetical protein
VPGCDTKALLPALDMAESDGHARLKGEVTSRLASTQDDHGHQGRGMSGLGMTDAAGVDWFPAGVIVI